MSKKEIFLKDEEATLFLGEALAKVAFAPCIIFLEGDLGMGKTTLTRGMLRGVGYKGRVKSPTYTLVEPYELDQQSIYHFDLYRLISPEELYSIGIEDYLHQNAICIIEWPDKGSGVLPPPDLRIQFTSHAAGRVVVIKAETKQGQTCLQGFK